MSTITTRVTLPLLALVTGLLFCHSAIAAENPLAPPQQVIQDISDQLHQIMLNDREQLVNEPAYVYRLANEILVPHVDFNKVASLVLGKYWRRATDDQKAEFTSQFKTLLVRTYSTAFNEFREWEIRHMPMRSDTADDDVSVHTQVLRPNAQPVDVVYRMHRLEGDWKAYDVKIEGISLVTNYRSSFTKRIRRQGMDGLIKGIAELNARRLAESGGVKTAKAPSH